jgi:hypothetical protein
VAMSSRPYSPSLLDILKALPVRDDYDGRSPSPVTKHSVSKE